jgi:hypothetical protein
VQLIERRAPGASQLLSVRARIHPATAALALLLAGAAALILYYGRHLSFFYDEWNFILLRRGDTVGTYLDPHNGHLSLFPIAVYKLLFAIVGLHHYWPYRAVLVALHLLCATLLYVLLRRRLGPWAALLPVALLLFMGSAYDDLLWPFQIGYLTSVAGGLGALVVLDRERPSLDLGASVLLAWSLSGSGVGVAFLIAAAALMLAQRSDRRRLWVVVVPAVLFAVWYVGWGSGNHVTHQSILSAPQYIANAAAGAAAGIAGFDQSWGPALAVAAILIGAASWRRHRGASTTPALVAGIVGALAFWGLAAIDRSSFAEPAAPRYLYIGAVFLWVMLADAGFGQAVRGRLWVGLILLLAAGAVIQNVGVLRDTQQGLASLDQNVRASLTAVGVAAPVVSPAFLPAPTAAPQITAGPYLAAERQLGTPAFSVQELERAPEHLRSLADQTLVHAEQLSPKPAARCARAAPTGRVEVPAGGTLTLTSSHDRTAALYLRRFATAFGTQPLVTIPAAGTVELRFPADRAPGVPWHAHVVSQRPAAVCVR